MNYLLIIDMLPTYGLLFYLLVSICIFVEFHGLRRGFGASPAVFPCGHVFDGVRTQRRIRRIGIRYNGAIVAAGYGRFLCLVSGGVFGRPHGALPLASHIRIIALKRAAGVNDKAR